ncbi:UDP-2,3-diacylglucosamine diphosphatase LpxG [Candidatus Protochlamydia phocaeensis]|uniref:UDP-2,3-diacylglucosamine diphosphatase LpxG n=1 Tax=Candidatus Protochlamydia phocaeensis TaxID=1414722 RepID=UPI000839466F|nr:UDP-2,3-diacylglucosamine diphosphatase LpxG [Candidatus Protochlamydia phocaeensis]
MRKKKWSEWLWDAWCMASVIGVWPRFIEPHLLSLTRLSLPIPLLSKDLIGLKILHMSDLHWNDHFSPLLSRKMINRIQRLQPDLIVCTGDFICRSKLENKEGLKRLLCALKAPLGCFAVLGNHDYERFVTVNARGEYDVEPASPHSDIGKGFKRLFNSTPLAKTITPEAQKVGLHEELINLLEQTPFQVLNNTTKLVAVKDSWINICGVGEYTLGRFQPQQAFQSYNTLYPGIILSHNPDTLTILKNYPGEIILAGHTHGGQVNLPGLWKKFTRIENLEFKRGLKRIGKKWAYINRGIASVLRFRWFSMPELTLITLGKG